MNALKSVARTQRAKCQFSPVAFFEIWTHSRHIKAPALCYPMVPLTAYFIFPTRDSLGLCTGIPVISAFDDLGLGDLGRPLVISPGDLARCAVISPGDLAR